MHSLRRHRALLASAIEIGLAGALGLAAMRFGLGVAAAGFPGASGIGGHNPAASGPADAAGSIPKRVYRNRLAVIEKPEPLLADYPEFVQPIVEKTRYEAPDCSTSPVPISPYGPGDSAITRGESLSCRIGFGPTVPQ